MSASSPSFLASDWSYPRTAAAFTGYVGNPARDGQGGPSGALALCVANTPIPCKLEGMASQKFVQFTVINIRKKGWSYAPWKRQTGKNAKSVKDENTKELFENGEWARNDVTTERVGSSVLMYSFIKDGQAKGERVDTSISTIASGQTFRVRLQDFMYEEKKGDAARNVFPADLDVIPAFSVVEVMFSPANQGGFDQGYGMSIGRVRPCEFSLYSLLNPLGLGLLPATYEESITRSEAWRQANPGLGKVLEEKNTGFFGKIVKGAYLIRYTEESFRLVGPKETPADTQSRHLDVMAGGIFSVDIRKEDMLRFTNASEAEDDDGLVYAQFIVELAAAAGALQCYVTYNEYLLRNDPNRSPYTAAPLIDTDALLACIHANEISGVVGQRFHLPFDFSPQEKPFLTLEPLPEESTSDEKGRGLEDLVLASENAHVESRAYVLTFGDATEEDIMRFLFVPKSNSSGGGNGLGLVAGRQDYRMLNKKRKTPPSASS